MQLARYIAYTESNPPTFGTYEDNPLGYAISFERNSASLIDIVYCNDFEGSATVNYGEPIKAGVYPLTYRSGTTTFESSMPISID